MGRMPRLVERGKKDRRLGEPREVSWEEIEALELDPRVELIRQLIPLGLAEVGRMLEEEVEQLAGQRHARKTEDDRHCRHGHNPGSVRLGGQRHPVRVPRVRGPAGESRLAAYEQLHGSPGEMDEGQKLDVIVLVSILGKPLSALFDYVLALDVLVPLELVLRHPSRESAIDIRTTASHKADSLDSVGHTTDSRID